MDQVQFSLQSFDFKRALVALLLSFGLAQAVAGVYILTFRGLSYTRTVVHSMAIGALVPCMLIMAVGNNIAAGIGVVGGLALVRFRSTLRDPRDMIFIFAALGVGVACGAGAFGVAISGTIVFSLAALLLHFTSYGARREFDGLVRFTATTSAGIEANIMKALRGTCRSFALVTLREAAQGGAMEHAYQISIVDPELQTKLVHDLRELPGVSDVTLMLQEPTLDL
ncbi:MAG: DUF4956 domain-containing protein [Myxococcales bacterium]|nr:DUF4956 domain-containing protein [Myxococcales bacterium]